MSLDEMHGGGPGAALRAQSIAHSRVLAAFVATGLFFMLLPGTFLGVWNLLLVSARQSANGASSAWLQAHGHAQVFGWVGSFILGIGLYSIPTLRAGSRSSTATAWVCWMLWTAGVAMRWTAGVYGWWWRVLVPVSAILELAAFAIFFRTVSRHRPETPGSGRFDLWVRIVITASMGLALTLVMNLAAAVYIGRLGASPALPHDLDQRFLAVVTWGFLAPFVWGFSTKWLPVLLGLRPMHRHVLAAGVAANVLGVVLALAGHGTGATRLFLIAATAVVLGLRVLEPPVQPARSRGVHRSFPAFVRVAYVWLIVAAVLGVAAAAWDVSGGIWGASRHAFTVGFVSVMVFSIGQRVLPAFAGAGPLWSPRLMFVALLLLVAGCLCRVLGEVVAYQTGAAWAWSMLAPSAVLEMTAVTAFAVNMLATFATAPVLFPAPVPGDGRAA